MPELLDKRLVIVTGKGGVGKSTVALALGLAAAAEGRRTIVCEVSSQEHTSRVFHRAEVGFHEVEMAENLWAISIDPDEAMREYVLLQLKVRAMRDLLFRSRIFTYLAAATPGLRELVTIGKIWEIAQPDRKVKKGAQVRPRDRRRAGYRPRRRVPADARAPSPTSPASARSRPRRRRSRRLSSTTARPGWRSSRCPRRCPSTRPRRSSASSTEEVGVAVDRVYMNALYPERFSKAELERLDEASARANGAAAGRRAARRSARAGAPQRQREQLARLAELVGAPVRTLPFVFKPELGVERDPRARRATVAG